MKGIFTISLDFELHWGGFEKWPLQNYQTYFQNTRRTIPKMLEAFSKYDVHVTWATVGILFHADKNSLNSVLPVLKPSYQARELSAYGYMEQHGIGNNELDDPYHYAQSLIERIVETPRQELASHTFSHYYCNEPGQTVDEFRADLQAAQRSAAKFGKVLRSLVFPRNQFNESYLRVCYEEGFTCVRDNPRDWFWDIRSTQNESFWKRLNRGADAYLPLGKMNTYSPASIEVVEGLPLCLPASRLLRPYRPSEYFLNTMKIARIKQELERAASRNEVYHLWWHPHNFGNYPEASMAGLNAILEHYNYCSSKYGMTSLTMGEMSDHILSRYGKA